MNNIKIFALDDEEKMLNFLKLILRNHTIITELNPLKAVKRLRDEDFDIFIIDYQMPRMTGLQVLKEINRLYKNKPIICILCTGFGTTYLFEEEKTQGLFHFFLEKPYDVTALKDVMTKAIVALGKMRSAVINSSDSL